LIRRWFVKPIHLLPPAMALLIVGAGMGYTRLGLDRLEAENVVLQKHAATVIRAEETPEELFPKAVHSRKVQLGISEGKWDWEAVAALVIGRRNGNGDSRALAEFQKRVAAMNEEELLAAIEEILALDLPGETRQYLLWEFMNPLEEKNPELALRRLFGRLGDGSFSNAWTEWLQKDLGAATAWFDEQIAAGKTEGKRLDGSDASRIQFEGQLIYQLFTSDPAAAMKRLEALPADLVEIVCRRFCIGGVNVSAQKTLADFYRSRFGEKECGEMVAGGMLKATDNDSFSSASAYLERIAASPAEKSASVSRVIERWSDEASFNGNVSVEKIEKLRKWVNEQSPDLSKNLIGEVITQMTRENGQSSMSLEQVLEIVSHYQAQEGGNEMLADTLEKGRLSNSRKSYLVALAGLLPDGEQRQNILKKLEDN